MAASAYPCRRRRTTAAARTGHGGSEGEAALALDYGAGDEAGAHEVADRVGDVLRAADPADGGLLGEGGELLAPLLLRQERPPRRVDHARGDRVDPDRRQL